MDAARYAALQQTLEAQLVLLTQLAILNHDFREVLGTPADRERLDLPERAARQGRLQALAEQAQLLRDELLALHRAYHAAYPP
jgi:hypothetical protein